MFHFPKKILVKIMSKILYTIGDSFTYGDELENPEIECYPYLLSQKLGCELVNEALPAASNDWMFRKTVQWISNQNLDDIFMVIVGRSNPHRREENFDFYWGGTVKYFDRWNWWNQGEHKTISKFISKYLWNSQLSYFKSFTYILTLQEFLKSKNIKYLFYDPFVNLLQQDNWYYEDMIKDTNMEKVIDSIDKRFFIGPEIDGKCVVDGQTKENSVTGRHPNADEHKWLSEKLYDIIS